METKTTASADRSILLRSALWYAGTSLGVTALFLVLTQIVGGYAKAAIVGGAIWSFLLAMIVTMPLYTAYFKRKNGGAS